MSTDMGQRTLWDNARWIVATLPNNQLARSRLANFISQVVRNGSRIAACRVSVNAP